MKNKKRIILIAVFLILVIAGGFTWRALGLRASRTAGNNLQTEPVQRGALNVTVTADGMVQANQSAQLLWRTSGTAEKVNVEPGNVVSTGQVLAYLEKTSLPQPVILAQADLISAQRQLDDLLTSQNQRAQALKAVEQAQQALDDALNNDQVQAKAQESVAQAQKAVKDAELNLAIVTKKPSQEAIDQAYANLVLAENVLNRTREQYDKVQRNLDKPKSNYQFFESKSLYRNLLKSLDLKLASDQRAYERALEKYNQLLEPVDPLESMVGEGNLKLAQAELDQAEREWERVKDGPSQAQVALLEAQLADAQREWARWKDGVDPMEIAAARARLAAAQAAVEQDHLIAPFDGVVTVVSVNPGDQVEKGTVAFRLDNISPMLVNLQVSEIDILRVQKDQNVILKFDAVPGVEYHGRITEVPMVAQDISGVTTFKVVVEILNPDEKVKPGMTVSAGIITSSLENVILVPNRAVHYKNGNPLVYVQREGQIVSVEIELGAASDTYSQLLQGDLQPGDRLLIDVPDNFVPNA